MVPNIIHTIIKYDGNKFHEYNNFKDYINYDNIKNIIEPFSGTASISFRIWLEYGDKFNYYINDKNKDIINYFKFHKETNLNEFIKKFNIDKQQYNTQQKFKELYDEWCINKDTYKYIILNKLSFMSLKMLRICNDGRAYQTYDTTSRINKYQIRFQEFLNSPNVFISNEDWKECYNKFKDDNTNLIIFDPPYIKSNNNNYNDDCRGLDVYDELNDIKKNKALSYFILEDIKETKELFKEWNMLSRYQKTYTKTKRKTFHIIYNSSSVE
jgi:hypothetical protein